MAFKHLLVLYCCTEFDERPLIHNRKFVDKSIKLHRSASASEPDQGQLSSLTLSLRIRNHMSSNPAPGLSSLFQFSTSSYHEACLTQIELTIRCGLRDKGCLPILFSLSKILQHKLHCPDRHSQGVATSFSACK